MQKKKLKKIKKNPICSNFWEGGGGNSKPSIKIRKMVDLTLQEKPIYVFFT